MLLSRSLPYRKCEEVGHFRVSFAAYCVKETSRRNHGDANDVRRPYTINKRIEEKTATASRTVVVRTGHQEKYQRTRRWNRAFDRESQTSLVRNFYFASNCSQHKRSEMYNSFFQQWTIGKAQMRQYGVGDLFERIGCRFLDFIPNQTTGKSRFWW